MRVTEKMARGIFIMISNINPLDAALPQHPATAPAAQKPDFSAGTDSFLSTTESDEKPPRKWNVLYYMAGNNSISEDMLKKIARMEAAGSDENVNILVQLGRASNAQYLPGGHRFYVTRHSNKQPEFPIYPIPFKLLDGIKEKKSTRVNSEPVQDLGPVDMSNPDNLADFISWGMKNYPAEHTLVVLMDHGYGFLGTPDDNEAQHTMTLNQLEEGLKKAEAQAGKKVDILGLDSCLMAQAEVAHQIKEGAHYLVASEEIEYPLGWPEGNIINRMKTELADRQLSPGECASLIVDENAKAPESMKTASAISLSGAGSVTEKAHALAEVLLHHIRENPQAKETLRQAIKNAHNYCLIIPGETLCQDYRDMHDLCRSIADSFSCGHIGQAAADLQSAVGEAVVAEAHKGEEGEGSHGLSVYIPTKGFITSYKMETGAFINPQERYLNTAFAKETSWDELIEELKEEPPPPPQ